MTDSELNARLHMLANQAADTHELLRGVTDALAVIGECAVRASTDDIDTLDDREAWRDEAETAMHQSEALLRKAAVLLNRATASIETSADHLGEIQDVESPAS